MRTTTIIPTNTPTNVQISLFPPDVPRAELWQSNERHQLENAPRLPTTTRKGGQLEIFTPTAPPPLLTKLWQSQQIANLGILDDKVYPLNGPAHNTHSKTQVCTITQEALLSCTHNLSKQLIAQSQLAMQLNDSTPLTCSRLFLTTGHLMEMRHLLLSPKYKVLWGKSYTTELGHLAQGMPGVSKGTDSIIFIHREGIPHPIEKIGPWARGQRVTRVKTICHSQGGHPYRPNPYSS